MVVWNKDVCKYLLGESGEAGSWQQLRHPGLADGEVNKHSPYINATKVFSCHPLRTNKVHVGRLYKQDTKVA